MGENIFSDCILVNFPFEFSFFSSKSYLPKKQVSVVCIPETNNHISRRISVNVRHSLIFKLLETPDTKATKFWKTFVLDKLLKKLVCDTH